MSELKNFSDQAVVIKRHNFGEADRIVTLFTLKHGKLVAVAKGVRKSTSRKAPHIEPFSYSSLYFATTRGMPIITQAETINSFDHIRNNLQTTRLAFHAIEVIDKIFVEQQSQPEAFHQLLKLLTLLDQSNLITQTDQELALTQFHKDLLSDLGFGMPKHQDAKSLLDYIEHIIDRRLTASKHLS